VVVVFVTLLCMLIVWPTTDSMTPDPSACGFRVCPSWYATSPCTSLSANSRSTDAFAPSGRFRIDPCSTVRANVRAEMWPNARTISLLTLIAKTDSRVAALTVASVCPDELLLPRSLSVAVVFHHPLSRSPLHAIANSHP